MKSPQQPISVIRISVQACLFVLALSTSTLSYSQTTAADVSTSTEAARAAKKSEVRAHAEKLRALREERERQSDLEAAAQAALPLNERKVQRTAAPALVRAHLAAEAERAIHAAVHHLGLSPKSGAGTAGFLLGVSGPWAHAKLLDIRAVDSAALSAISAGVAEAGSGYLAERYAVAEQNGRIARYIALALLAAGMFKVVQNKLSRRTARVSRRTSRLSCEAAGPSQKSTNTGTGMFKFLNRKSTKPTEKQEPGHAVVAAFDMDTLRDYAYNLLFARGRHDLAGVSDMVTANFARCLQTHFQTLESKGHWNKVERVCAIKCEEVESWQEAETSIAKLHVSWKALDYIVNFNRRPGEAGYVVDGDPSKMEEFYEEWVVTRRAGDAWQVDAMYPAERRNIAARA